MKHLNAPAGWVTTALLFLFVLSATACNETPPPEEDNSEDKKQVVAPLATLQKDFMLAALKSGELDEETAAVYKSLANQYQKQEERFLRFGKERPGLESDEVSFKIIRLCPCQVNPDHLRLCPCPQPKPPTMGGFYDDIPEYQVLVSSGRGPEVELKPEITELKKGYIVTYNLSSIKYGDQITVVVKGEKGTQTSMDMVKEDGTWFRVNPFQVEGK